MDPHNAIEINKLSKSFKIHVEEPSPKNSVLRKKNTKTVENKVLDNITFNVPRGEVLGILGRNGSGKSTLLSIIAKIIDPDSGTIERSGKIASILELGMGFHPDMTGRENIFLKGELYGFSHKDMETKIDEIIEYSGIDQYIDNPVRTYSSGMRGRLAFSIMIHVDADIMLVDEVLSVGDTAFETKAREHFKKLAISGKTIIFVSHNIKFIESVCNRAIWIENGKIVGDGPSKIICSEYENKINESPEIVIDLANSGVADAQYKLAIMYRDGTVFGCNLELYEYWMEQAAFQGHTLAQVEYGDILMDKGDLSAAVNNYRLAASKGDSNAKAKISMLSSSEDETISELLKIYSQIANRGNALNEYRYADLLLKTAWNNEDRKRAFQKFLDSANDGYPNAMHQLGIMYKDGVGTTRDPIKMEEYLIKAADRGFIPSILLLSDLYFQGKLLNKNEEKAFDYSLKAALLGNINSMYKVATMYRDGIGTVADADQSQIWFNRYHHATLYPHYVWTMDALKTGIVETKIEGYELLKLTTSTSNSVTIGNLLNYELLNDLKVDDETNKIIYLAESNNIDALKRLGNIYYEGAIVKKDISAAISCYMRASDLGDVWCKLRLGEIYSQGRGVPVNVEESVRWYMDAAKQGNAVAAETVVRMYGSGLVDDEQLFNKSIKILESLASFGSIDAIRRIANIYYEGIGVKRDYEKAFSWYQKGTKLEDSVCMTHLSEMYKNGKGTECNLKLAADIYMRINT